VKILDQLVSHLSYADAILVSVQSTRGSVPRDVGAWMAVFAQGIVGTVGGGHLEFDAIAHARQCALLAGTEEVQRYALGPGLGQCCGGEVHLRYERVTAADIPTLNIRLRSAYTPVALFGGGHVGSALIDVLGNLPFVVRWIDSRDEIFPQPLSANVQCEHSEPVDRAVSDLVAGSHVLVMSFSHAEDLDIVAACLVRQRAQGDLPYVGLIGSKTKWASFRQRLQSRGFTEAEIAHITCPIGVSGIADKRPEVIAVGVAAQLLQRVRF
jgi:xanthine dehydrogenase accessory factor